jgi:hypothetical protein
MSARGAIYSECLEEPPLLTRPSVARVPRGWQVATVSRLVEETARAKTIVLDVPGWAGHVAGQNVDVADEFDLHGPIGGPFTWRVDDGGPLLLVADGSGLVPLMAMLRHRAAKWSRVDARLLISKARPPKSSIAASSCAGGRRRTRRTSHVHARSTRHVEGFARCLDADMLKAIGPAPGTNVHGCLARKDRRGRRLPHER